MIRIIKTDKAPAAIGPYSQAVETNGILYISGQIPLHPQTGQTTGSEINKQTMQVLDNIGAILVAAGYTFRNVVKTTCYLKNLGDFAAMNEVYATYFTVDPPARATVEVSRLPKDVLIEIEAVAII